MNDITPKEAIANLNHIYGFVAPDIQRSLDVAIKALEEHPSGDCISRRVLKGLISDKSIPIKFEEEKRGEWRCSSGVLLRDIYKVIDNVPPVEINEQTYKDAYDQGYTDGWKERYGEPDGRPKGEWIDRMADKGYVECPFCGKEITGGDLNFCVKCGADMRKGGTE